MFAGGEWLAVSAVRGCTSFGCFGGGGHDDQGAHWTIGSEEIIYGGFKVSKGGSVAFAISRSETLIVVRRQQLLGFHEVHVQHTWREVSWRMVVCPIFCEAMLLW